MHNNAVMPKSKISLTILKWLSPNPLNTIIYSSIILLCLILSNVTNLQEAANTTGGLDIKGSVLNFIDTGLADLLGIEIASGLANAIFWGLIGLVTYSGLVLLGRFFSELEDDLAVTKYVYPAGSDNYGQLKRFLMISAERIIAIILLVVYLRALFDVWFSNWLRVYEDSLRHWPPGTDALVRLSLTIVVHFIAMHGVVILTRLILLRKQAISG
jgi:hypothetical protein